jgi:two-component system cell cycle sensor histidine kinase PleC
MARVQTADAPARRRMPNIAGLLVPLERLMVFAGRRSGTRPIALSGHARLLAAPAYARLVENEAVFRRAIPILTVIFILVIAAYRSAALVGAYEEAEVGARDTLSLIATTVAAELAATPDIATSGAETLQTALDQTLPPRAAADGRQILLADADGLITATAPVRTDLEGRTLNALLGESQPLTIFGARAGVLELTLTDGTDAIATVRHLPDAHGMVALVQPTEAVFADWRRSLSANATLFACTSGVILVLVYAFFAQSTRAREADAIYGATRARIDTALLRGRCGLIDWDLARGRMFWSASMYDILGREPRDELLGFHEVSTLVHPEDGDLFALADGILASGGGTVDRTLRLAHADGRWVWLRIRAELVAEAGGGSPHLIGIAMDVTEQHRLAQRYQEADQRLARRHRMHLRGLRAVGQERPSRHVQRALPAGLWLPDDVLVPGTDRATVHAAREPARSSSGASRTDDGRHVAHQRGPACRRAAGCRSTSGAPATAASSRSAPTSP